MANQRFFNIISIIIICLISGCSSRMSSKEPFVTVLTDDGKYQELLSGFPQTAGMRAGKVYLEPNKDCSEHSTGDHEEMLVFLAGNGEAVIGEGKTLKVGAGKILYIPPNTVHNIRNVSNEPLCYIYCVAPANK